MVLTQTLPFGNTSLNSNGNNKILNGTIRVFLWTKRSNEPLNPLF